MCEVQDRYEAAIKNPREAVKVLGIGDADTVFQAAQKLFPHYCRVNGGEENNPITEKRVMDASHDLIERGHIETWIARACATMPSA